MSMCAEAGTLGRPGMVMMSPVTSTMKPAPAERRTSRTSMVCPFGAPSDLGFGGEGVLRLRHAHGQVGEAVGDDLRELLAGPGGEVHPGGAVQLGRDRLGLLLDRALVGVGEPEVRRAQLQLVEHAPRERLRAGAAVGEVGGGVRREAEALGQVAHRLDLRVRVGGEPVDRHHRRQPEHVAQVRQVPLDVGEAPSDRLDVLLLQVGHRDPAVELQRPDGGHHHDRVGAQAGHPALDVDELLGAEVRPEAGLGDHDVGELERRAGGDHRVAAVRDVGERSAVHEGRRVLEGLHEVGGERVLEQHRERALGAEVRGE